MLRVVARAARRAYTTSASSSGGGRKPAPDVVESLASKTPGITRLRKGGGGGRVVEVDSTIARIMGSDWGDRRNQSVSLPMRLYWIVFGLVLANGAYTYFSGKDEMYLVDKVQKKVDEKLGVVETNEFVVMADARPTASGVATSEKSSATPASKAVGEQKTSSAATPATAPRASVLSSSSAPPAPFFRPSAAPAPAARPQSKADLQTQLQQVRAKQQQLRQDLQSGASFRDVEDVEVEIRLLDQQKAQLKRMIKRL